ALDDVLTRNILNQTWYTSVGSLRDTSDVTPPDGAWTEYVSEGVTSS
ncbi:hypothetical protein Tco_0734121, partial [Tanacetum coccineum]